MSLQQTAKATVAAQQQKFLHCLEKFRDKGAHRLETFLSTLSGEQLEEMVVDFLEDHWRDLKPVKSREIREPCLVSGDVRSNPARNGLSSCHAIIGCSFSQWFLIIYRTVQRQNHLTAISKVHEQIGSAELRRVWIRPDRLVGESCITFLAFCWELPTQLMVMRTRAKLWQGRDNGIKYKTATACKVRVTHQRYIMPFVIFDSKPFSVLCRCPYVQRSLLGACQDELKTLREYLLNVYTMVLKHWYPEQSELQEAGRPGSKDWLLCFLVVLLAANWERKVRESGSFGKQISRSIRNKSVYIYIHVLPASCCVAKVVCKRNGVHQNGNMSNFCSCSFASFSVCEFDHWLSTSVCWRCRDFFREQQDAQDEDMAWTSVEDGISIPIQSPEEAKKILRAVDSEWKLQQSISLPHGVKAGSSDVDVFFLRSFPSCCDLSGLSRGRARLGPSRNHRRVWRAH